MTQQAPSRRRRHLSASIIIPGAIVIGVAVLALWPHFAPSHSPAGPQTVTYGVTGSDADVTYGPAGSELTGSVPMQLTRPLGNPAYYAINAQLQGAGTVTCQLAVNGTVISQATADGGYHVAICEISRNPATGQWADVNQG